MIEKVKEIFKKPMTLLTILGVILCTSSLQY